MVENYDDKCYTNEVWSAKRQTLHGNKKQTEDP